MRKKVIIKNQIKDLFMLDKFNDAINEFKETSSFNEDELLNGKNKLNKAMKESLKTQNDKLQELDIDNLFQKLKNIDKLI